MCVFLFFCIERELVRVGEWESVSVIEGGVERGMVGVGVDESVGDEWRARARKTFNSMLLSELIKNKVK